MATIEEYEVLRDIVWDIGAIFSRVLEYDDNYEYIYANEEEKQDRERVNRISSDVINGIEQEFIDYESVKNELVKIRDKYKNRPYSKAFIADSEEADKELGRG
jgi:hypothetical protein